MTLKKDHNIVLLKKLAYIIKDSKKNHNIPVTLFFIKI